MATNENSFREFVERVGEIVKAVGEPLEGNCLFKHQTMDPLPFSELKQRNFLKAGATGARICEIGFNAGFSAYLLLSGAVQGSAAANQKPHMLIFDLGEHRYAAPALEALRADVGDRATVEACWGDSRTGVAQWLHSHPTEIGSFDVVHVDGGHSIDCIISDMLSAVILTRPGGLIIVDDVNDLMILDVVNMWVTRGSMEVCLDYLPTFGYQHMILRRL